MTGSRDQGKPWRAAVRLLRDRPAARPTLLLLTAAYGLQYLDRMLVGLFAPSIKADLQLSDTQIGLITGVAFSLFYVASAMPLARLADRADRKMIVVASLAAMSVATAAFGLMGSLAGLFVARACVAIGEAGATPTSASLLAGLYDSRDRQIAMSLYSGGGFAGMAIALLALASLSELLGWRQLFQAAGVAGLAVALWLAWRLPAAPRAAPVTAGPAGFAGVQLRLLRIPSFTLLSLALSAALLGSAAGTNWVASFLARSYGMAQGEILLFLAAAWGGGALLGTIMFGSFNATLRARGARAPLAMLALAVLGFAASYIFAFSMRTPAASLAGIALALFCIGGLRGPTFALVQDIVPDAHQAAGNALLLVMTFLIGSMLGPLLTGMISDALTPRLGQEALRTALFAVLTAGGGASLLLLGAAALSIERDLARKAAGA